MKRMRNNTKFKISILLGLVLLLSMGLAACGKKVSEDAEVKEKVEEANKKVQELEKEDEKDREFVFREEDSGAVLTKYNGTDEEVVIPGEYNGLAVVKIEAYTFKDNQTVKVIEIPPTVTTIQNATLQEGCGITIRGYSNTYAEFYAAGLGLPFESLGENALETDTITIWDKEGAHCTNLYRGQIIEDEALKGVTFKKSGGKSVLVLDNCDIGSVEVSEYAALTIELAEGSENKISGARGRDGIRTNGSLTIKGNGKLSVFGADYFSIDDGANAGSSIGSGLFIGGNLNIEENAGVYAKSGNGKGDYAIGVYVYGGNITASGGMLEAVAGESEDYQVPAILVDCLDGISDESRGGQIVLNNIKITGGGAIVPVIYRGTDEGTGTAYEETGGQSISGGSEVGWTEEGGYEGASGHIIIGQ